MDAQAAQADEYTRYLEQEIARFRALKNDAFHERNQLVALISKIYPAKLGKDESGQSILENVVYIDLPTGQASWHITKDEIDLFAHLSKAGDDQSIWDGHTKQEKIERVNTVSAETPLPQIFKKGSHAIPKKLLEQARKSADISFCVTHSDDLFEKPDLLPLDTENFPISEAGILIRSNPCVEPHKDCYVGHGDSPVTQKSLFWLLDNPSGKPIHLQVGSESIRLNTGDYVILNDAVMHCVVASNVWRGVAWQMCHPDHDIKKKLRSLKQNQGTEQ